MASSFDRKWGRRQGNAGEGYTEKTIEQNYWKSLLALGFQAFLIMVCVGIYAVLVQNIAVGDDITVAIWECMGYTVLLCYTLFKTGSLAKSLFGAH